MSRGGWICTLYSNNNVVVVCSFFLHWECIFCRLLFCDQDYIAVDSSGFHLVPALRTTHHTMAARWCLSSIGLAVPCHRTVPQWVHVFHRTREPITAAYQYRSVHAPGMSTVYTNVILRAVSCIVRNRFLSVGSQFGITAYTISKCGIKDAMAAFIVFFKIFPTLFSFVF